jgi:hypothetical protein
VAFVRASGDLASLYPPCLVNGERLHPLSQAKVCAIEHNRAVSVGQFGKGQFGGLMDADKGHRGPKVDFGFHVQGSSPM